MKRNKIEASFKSIVEEALHEKGALPTSYKNKYEYYGFELETDVGKLLIGASSGCVSMKFLDIERAKKHRPLFGRFNVFNGRDYDLLFNDDDIADLSFVKESLINAIDRCFFEKYDNNKKSNHYKTIFTLYRSHDHIMRRNLNSRGSGRAAMYHWNFDKIFS